MIRAIAALGRKVGTWSLGLSLFLLSLLMLGNYFAIRYYLSNPQVFEGGRYDYSYPAFAFAVFPFLLLYVALGIVRRAIEALKEEEDE